MGRVKEVLDKADTEEALNRIYKEYQDLIKEIRELNSKINRLEVERNKLERRKDKLDNKAAIIRENDPLDPDIPEVPDQCSECESEEIIRIAHGTGDGWHFNFECQNCYALGETINKEKFDEFAGWWPGAEHELLSSDQLEEIGFTVV